MIRIDECLIEKVNCELSCTNQLIKNSNFPYTVFTNLTSFVGVRAEIIPKCECAITAPLVCLNNGTQVNERECKCRRGYDGPECQMLSVSFNGDGWAMYPPFESCADLKISFEITPLRGYGLVLYLGPLQHNPLLPLSDFLALELRNGYPVLMVDYGSGAIEIPHKQIQLTDGKSHKIEILLSSSVSPVTTHFQNRFSFKL